MRRAISIVTLLVVSSLFFTACSQQKPAVFEELFDDVAIKVEKSAPPSMPPSSGGSERKTLVADDAANAAADSEKPADAPHQTELIAPMLAYEYAMSVRLPINKVVPQMRADVDKCMKAGPIKCQVINSRSNEGDGSSAASLSIKAEPQWLETFKSGLDKDAKDNGGRILSSSISSEDLTMQITDTEARLRALTSLRSRLEKIIAERPGKLSDLLEAEQELARVQGEVDSYTSQLNVSRARVKMSVLNIDYSSVSAAVSGGIFEPIKQAFSGFFYTMMSVFGFIITAFSIIIPIAIVIFPVWHFIIRRFLVSRKNKKATIEKAE